MINYKKVFEKEGYSFHIEEKMEFLLYDEEKEILALKEDNGQFNPAQVILFDVREDRTIPTLILNDLSQNIIKISNKDIYLSDIEHLDIHEGAE